MTDWRQIQARIRKAKNSPDALTKLNELFQRTRDGMVAWELGVVEEKAERMGEALTWYTVAAERFRRAEWKKKAEEAVVRLGGTIPVATSAPKSEEHSEIDQSLAAELSGVDAKDEDEEPEASPSPLAYGEIPESEYDQASEANAQAAVTAAASTAALEDAGATTGPLKKKRRRGRRGGRGRRRKDVVAAPGLPMQAFAESSDSPLPKPELPKPLPFRQPEQRAAAFERPSSVERAAIAERPIPEPIRQVPVEMPSPAPQLPSERSTHGRAGDPALASRMAQLESMLRRLLSSPLHRLDEAEHAPAGPGVFLLSDSDQVTSYYVEACQTLRVGLGNLGRGGRTGKSSRGGRTFSESGFKNKLAEHLGINESKVAQYMKDHCVVRWIQLDVDAPHLAHFVISLLRTPLNVDD
jgi:hypothetical protein